MISPRYVAQTMAHPLRVSGDQVSLCTIPATCWPRNVAPSSSLPPGWREPTMMPSYYVSSSGVAIGAA
ncbi:hypothetical protein [Neoasaia chiangmaiensis]|uniref:Uncharacterized protein n=1 Tax=Neoasaia chiangmaiensis TaxID=320497 RepID=A0A1U9KPQ3_9PROT|nr:hypothetical protein [Neoasaia chiangmaiensis]AQS87680.1 hypothetical protein A0U93_06760 [Neoasaia chiangmaiensis]